MAFSFPLLPRRQRPADLPPPLVGWKPAKRAQRTVHATRISFNFFFSLGHCAVAPYGWQKLGGLFFVEELLPPSFLAIGCRATSTTRTWWPRQPGEGRGASVRWHHVVLHRQISCGKRSIHVRNSSCYVKCLVPRLLFKFFSQLHIFVLV